MTTKYHQRRSDPPDVRYPSSAGHSFGEWFRAILQAVAVGLLAYGASVLADMRTQNAIFNYRLTRIEQELGIKPMSVRAAPGATVAKAES